MPTTDPLRIARAHLLLRRIVSDYEAIRTNSRTAINYEPREMRERIVEIAYLLLDDHQGPLPYLPNEDTVAAATLD
jgi:hypothetical protein